MIPTQFNIAGGKTIKVLVREEIKDKDGYKFGKFNDASNTIKIARKLFIDDECYPQTDEDMERTYYHELFHAFQFYAGMELDEMVAQTFSNFMYEYEHSKNND